MTISAPERLAKNVRAIVRKGVDVHYSFETDGIVFMAPNGRCALVPYVQAREMDTRDLTAYGLMLLDKGAGSCTEPPPRGNMLAMG